MADEGIFVTTAEVLRKAGANVSATSSAEAFVNQYVAEAESWINAVTGVNYSDTYSTLNADKRDILKRWAGAIAAGEVVDYDGTTMPARETERRLDFLDNQANQCKSLMKEKKGSDFVTKA